MALRCATNHRSLINSIFNWASPRMVTPCLQRCITTCIPLQTNEGRKRKRALTMDRPEGVIFHVVKAIDPLESMKYMESEAYREMYGEDPVWKNYRRNSSGRFKNRPRKQCIRVGKIATGSACPICRDDYLVFDYRNVKLMNQFLDVLSGEPKDIRKTGLCVQQHKQLTLEVLKSKDYGYLQAHFPFRIYNYDYYNDLRDEKLLQLVEDPEERKKIEQNRIQRRKEHVKKERRRAGSGKPTLNV